MSPTPRAPRAVVFDLDGTLIDSLPLVLRALSHALAPYIDAPLTMDVFGHLGGPPARFLPHMVRRPQDAPEALRRLDAFHREKSHLLRPFEGARGLLEALHAHGTPLGIWTGRDRASTEWLLRTHRLESYFSAIVCGDDLPTHKPDPQGLRQILQDLGTTPTATLYIGDADVDVEAGAACGVSTVLIRHTREVRPEIRAQAWREVATPAASFELALAWTARTQPPRRSAS